ncbi:hypothetical protein K7W42_16695 [Deinococcus sp. HMF7604]|uniref:hypothetical protein n=1 Tax=Deinococcus betulae TaxID=2873312 RepID=UPI001CCB3065|nr:hypothetical protein [Deinococcus betulae]MBZ9752488.1 hypothetical protein [Deinococcus betulae]
MLNSFKNIEPLVSRIELLASRPDRYVDSPASRAAVADALNGQLSKTLRHVVPISTLQEYGAFFTSDTMSDELVADLSDEEIASGSVFDPTCGGGNLLLAYARRLPIKATLSETLELWGQKIHGFDLHEAFVRSTRARLALLASYRGTEVYGSKYCDKPISSLERAFPNIRSCDAVRTQWPKVQYLLLNPPYNRVASDDNCEWASGKVSLAAKFIELSLNGAIEGASIRAILPDVLRAGSNYRSWRELLNKKSYVEQIKILGQFDTDTKVDVFLLRLNLVREVTSSPAPWMPQSLADAGAQENLKVRDFFDVSVGRVVPHRDAEIGELVSYIHAKHLPPWKIIRVGGIERRFTGVTFRPPFVLVRRTSRSKDANRAVATIVRAAGCIGKKVAVENHLIILQPKSKRLRDCKELMGRLSDSRTNNWLNDRIRCRHLTVSALQDLPWWSE